MNRLGRRTLLAGAALIGAGALGYGGSILGCAVRDGRLAMLDPLFVALGDIHAPADLGAAWLAEETAERAGAALLARPEIFAASLLPDALARRDQIGAIIRDEFLTGDVVLAGGWVAARSEARLSACWIGFG